MAAAVAAVAAAAVVDLTRPFPKAVAQRLGFFVPCRYPRLFSIQAKGAGVFCPILYVWSVMLYRTPTLIIIGLAALLTGCISPKPTKIKYPTKSQKADVRFFLEGNNPKAWSNYELGLQQMEDKQWRKAVNTFTSILDIQLDRTNPPVVNALKAHISDGYVNLARDIYAKRTELIHINTAVDAFLGDAKKYRPGNPDIIGLEQLTQQWMRQVYRKNPSARPQP